MSGARRNGRVGTQRKQNRNAYMGVLIVMIIFFSIALILPQWFARAQAQTRLPISLHSNEEADYSADPHPKYVPAIGLGILQDILTENTVSPEEVSARMATVTAVLNTPIPTATPAPGLRPAATSVPLQPENPTATQVMNTESFRGTSTPTPSPTGTPAVSPTFTATIAIYPRASATSTRKPGDGAPEPVPSPTNVMVEPSDTPTKPTSKPTPVPTKTKAPESPTPTSTKPVPTNTTVPASSTPQPTPTPKPTKTPAPTNTAIPPSSTPIPPQPTNTPIPPSTCEPPTKNGFIDGFDPPDGSTVPANTDSIVISYNQPMETSGSGGVERKDSTCSKAA